MASKDDYKAVSSLIIGAVSASLVLFPSILGVVAKPLVLLWALWFYLLFGVISFLALGYTYYRAAYTSGDLPVKASGVGVISGVACIGLFAIFLFANLLSDQRARPVITSVTAGAYSASPGDMMNFAARGEDQNGDRLTWQWRIDPDPRAKPKPASVTLPSKLEAAVWRVPDAAPTGIYSVTATVSDGPHTSAPETIQIDVRKKP